MNFSWKKFAKISIIIIRRDPKYAFEYLELTLNRIFVLVWFFLVWGHSFSTYAKFSENLTFLTPWSASFPGKSAATVFNNKIELFEKAEG